MDAHNQGTCSEGNGIAIRSSTTDTLSLEQAVARGRLSPLSPGADASNSPSDMTSRPSNDSPVDPEGTAIGAYLAPTATDIPESSRPTSYDLVDGVVVLSDRKISRILWVRFAALLIVITAVVCGAVVGSKAKKKNGSQISTNAVAAANNGSTMPPSISATALPTSPPTLLLPTLTPTNPPTSEQFVLVVEQVAVEFGTQLPVEVENSRSTTYRAASWLAQEGLFTFPLVYLPTNAALVSEYLHFYQRYALAVLYYSTGGGDGLWKDDCQFLSPAHVCSWRCPLPRDFYASYENPIDLGVVRGAFLSSNTTMGVFCGEDFVAQPTYQKMVFAVDLGRSLAYVLRGFCCHAYG